MAVIQAVNKGFALCAVKAKDSGRTQTWVSMSVGTRGPATHPLQVKCGAAVLRAVNFISVF